MDNLNFKMIDENNKEIDCKILHHFSYDDNYYIIYSDYTYDKNGHVNIYACKYVIDNNENVSLIPIENENEWNIINQEWDGVNNE